MFDFPSNELQPEKGFKLPNLDSPAVGKPSVTNYRFVGLRLLIDLNPICKFVLPSGTNLLRSVSID